MDALLLIAKKGYGVQEDMRIDEEMSACYRLLELADWHVREAAERALAEVAEIGDAYLGETNPGAIAAVSAPWLKDSMQ